MNQINLKTKLLRLIWGILPWMMVLLIVVLIFIFYGKIMEEKARIEADKQAAVKKETVLTRVITLTVSGKRLEDKINLPGYIEAMESLWIKSEVSGLAKKILAEEGQRIQKGQAIIEIDDRDYRSRLESIEANYKLAKLEYDRILALNKKKITAENQLDEVEAKLKEISAQRELASLALSRTRIVAPIDGFVNEIKIKKGGFVGIGEEIAHVLQISDVKITVGIPESDVASIFKLKTADVIIEALDKRRVKGKKVLLSREPKNLAHLYDLELAVPNPDGDILPGMFARVELIKEVYQNALVVPLYAVINQGDEQFVYIEKDGVAKKRPVEIGLLVDWQVQVTSGLNENDNVIVVGHRFLNEDQPVEVIQNVTDVLEILKR